MDNESDFLQAQVRRAWAVTLQAQQPGTGSDHTYFAVHRRYNGVQPQEVRQSRTERHHILRIVRFAGMDPPRMVWYI